MTWEQFKALAMEHYNDGGDGIIECWNESDFNEYVQEFGPISKNDALAMFADNAAVWDDMAGYADAVTDYGDDDDGCSYDEYETLDDRDSDWRPGDAPWRAPGMSVSDFI